MKPKPIQQTLRQHLILIILVILTLFFGHSVLAINAKIANQENAILIGKRQPNQIEPVTSSQLSDTKSPSVNATTPWKIPFWLVPSGDGDSLFVFTGQVAKVEADVSAEASIGGGPATGIGMAYNAGSGGYEGNFSEILTPGSATVEGNIGLTAELAGGDILDTGNISFRRFSVPTVGASPAVADDNLLEMTFSDHSLLADAYVAVMTTNAVPGPLPVGYRLIGQPYGVFASGANVTSNKPLLLKLSYSSTTSGLHDPHTFSILQWDPVNSQWEELGGSLDDLIGKSLTTTTSRFTVYALVGTTRWQDEFTDFTGLEEHPNTDILVGTGELLLDGVSLSGSATSRIITPTTTIDTWGTLTFTRTVPAGTSLTIDVLDAGGNLLLSDVSNNTSLATLDPALYPSLKLRAGFTTDDAGKTAVLDQWQITWQPISAKSFLPVMSNNYP